MIETYLDKKCVYLLIYKLVRGILLNGGEYPFLKKENEVIPVIVEQMWAQSNFFMIANFTGSNSACTQTIIVK